MGAFRIFSRFAELLDVNVTRAAATWLRLNTDGTVTERTAAQTLADIGAAPSSGIAASAITGTAVTLTGTQTISGAKTFTDPTVISNDFFVNGDLDVGGPGTFSGQVTATTFSGSGSGLTGIALTTAVTGILPGANGGTGVANTGKTLTLGANSAINQDVSTTANPTFAGLSASGYATFNASAKIVGSLSLQNPTDPTKSNNLGTDSNGYLSVNNMFFGGNFGTGTGHVAMEQSAFSVGTSGAIKFTPTYAWVGAEDTTLTRKAEGELQIGTGSTANALGSLALTNITVTGLTTATGGIVLGTKTVGTLPTASSNPYLEFIVTDSLTPAVGATVAAGGSAKCKVISNGSAWIISTVL